MLNSQIELQKTDFMTTFAKKKAGGKGVTASGNGGLVSNNLLKNKQIGMNNEVQEQ